MPASSISPSPAPSWHFGTSIPSGHDTQPGTTPDLPAFRTTGDPSTLPSGPLGPAKRVLQKNPDPAASRGHKPADEASQIDRKNPLVIEQSDNADKLRQLYQKEAVVRVLHDALERVAKLSSDETQRGQTERNQLHG